MPVAENARLADTVMFMMDFLFAGTALAMRVHSRSRGSCLDAHARRGGGTTRSPRGERAIALDDVARIRVQRPEECEDRVFLYRHDGALLHFPSERSVPLRCHPVGAGAGHALPAYIRVDVEGR